MPEGRSHAFDIDQFSKHCLLEGIDELDYTLAQMDRIDAFARRRAEEEGWTVPGGCRASVTRDARQTSETFRRPAGGRQSET